MIRSRDGPNTTAFPVSPRRLTVGDRVKLTTRKCGNFVDYEVGDTGEIVSDDHEEQPYEVEMDDPGKKHWAYEDCVEPEY